MERFEAQPPQALARAAIDDYGWPVALDASSCRCEWIRPASEPGYGIPTRESADALHRVAHDEGYLLDPTYTAKAAAVLLAMAADGRLAPGGRVLFLHTGGLSTTAAGPNH
jgi:1-aminocyclopropane-1-carboxylate deaminase/D-cysteine desulfhydrase-like pyridoxal-dependent ACC family enzyme